MKKRLPWIAGALVVVLLAAYVGVDLFLGSVVKAGVNHFGPAITGTKVELVGAHISPLSGGGTLSGFLVGNPAGWTEGRALYLAKVRVSIVPTSIFSDHIVVNEILIDGGEFVYETKFVASNIGDLLKNIEKQEGSASVADQPKAGNGKPMKFEVRKFRISNSKVILGVGEAAITLPMPPVSLDNVGTAEGGVTAGQLAFAVMRSITGSIVSATTHAAGKVGETMGAAAGSAAKSAGNTLKGLFNSQKQ
jgi:hypothetical protein